MAWGTQNMVRQQTNNSGITALARGLQRTQVGADGGIVYGGHGVVNNPTVPTTDPTAPPPVSTAPVNNTSHIPTPPVITTPPPQTNYSNTVVPPDSGQSVTPPPVVNTAPPPPQVGGSGSGSGGSNNQNVVGSSGWWQGLMQMYYPSGTVDPQAAIRDAAAERDRLNALYPGQYYAMPGSTTTPAPGHSTVPTPPVPTKVVQTTPAPTAPAPGTPAWWAALNKSQGK